MASTYTVRSGDTLTKIAQQNGYPSWKTIYYAIENGDFRRKRPNPNLIFPGDQIVLPGQDCGPPETPPDGQVAHCGNVGLRTASFALVGTAQKPSADNNAFFGWGDDPPSPKDVAIGLANTARLRAGAAADAADRVYKLLEIDADLSGSEDWKAACTHFKVYQLSGKEAQMERMKLIFGRFWTIGMLLSHSKKYFEDSQQINGDFAFTRMGGLLIGGEKIYFCPRFLIASSDQGLPFTTGPTFRVGVIIHEAAHFSDVSVGHIASELPAYQGSMLNDDANRFRTGHNYSSMSADEAVCNAYSYAQFCLHIFKGFDYRITTFAE
jgi:hypothetical protein